MSIELSLVCPIYKVRKYILDLLNSLVAGINVPEVEMIFINDCCPEGSMDICKEYLNKNFKQIKFAYKFIDRNINGGLSAARNDALPLATGHYVGFVDSDDVISRHYWEFLSEKIYSRKSDIIEFGYSEFRKNLPMDVKPVEKPLNSSQLNPYKTGFFVWTRLFRRKMLVGLTFPEGMIYEDVYYVTHAFSRARSTERFSAKLVFYRKRCGAITGQRTSSYSQLLENLVHSTSNSITRFAKPKLILEGLTENVFLVMLRGLRIPDHTERCLFFRLSKPLLDELAQLYKNYHPGIKSHLLILLSRMICDIGIGVKDESTSRTT